jgi:SAM-dependent methyltransferase
MTTPDAARIKDAVRARYAEAARADRATCCGPAGATQEAFGRSQYGSSDTGALPEAALAASLGCGNPTLFAYLAPGEVVLDLGSSGGIDVLLSARRVAPGGIAYGLDMTPEMLALARHNRAEAGVTNAEFLEGGIEAVPLPDESVDVIISNCVVNLSPDKPAVFREAFRVLRPGGRLAISDVVLRRPLPPPLQQVIALWTGCIAGALTAVEYRAALELAGFEEVSVESVDTYDGAVLAPLAVKASCCADPADRIDVEAAIAAADGAAMSAFIRGRKPAR